MSNKVLKAYYEVTEQKLMSCSNCIHGMSNKCRLYKCLSGLLLNTDKVTRILHGEVWTARYDFPYRYWELYELPSEELFSEGDFEL